jgi:hypothetical protein
MLTEETLEELQCAISNEQHFLINPIPLIKCGHSICRNCLPTYDPKSIKCKLCGLTSEQNFKNTEVSKPTQKYINLCISEIYEVLEKEHAYKLNQLKGFHSSLNLFVLNICNNF